MKITKVKREKLCRHVEQVRKMNAVAPNIKVNQINTLFKKSAKKTAFNRTLSPEQKEQLNYSYGLE